VRAFACINPRRNLASPPGPARDTQIVWNRRTFSAESLQAWFGRMVYPKRSTTPTFAGAGFFGIMLIEFVAWHADIAAQRDPHRNDSFASASSFVTPCQKC
jgi:hypothetical protein